MILAAKISETDLPAARAVTISPGQDREDKDRWPPSRRHPDARGRARSAPRPRRARPLWEAESSTSVFRKVSRWNLTFRRRCGRCVDAAAGPQLLRGPLPPSCDHNTTTNPAHVGSLALGKETQKINPASLQHLTCPRSSKPSSPLVCSRHLNPPLPGFLAQNLLRKQRSRLSSDCRLFSSFKFQWKNCGEKWVINTS